MKFIAKMAQAQIKAVILDMGGVLIQSPMQYWSEMEKELGFKNGSIQKTILSGEVVERFHELERGQLTLEDFDHIFTYFYNKQVCEYSSSFISFNLIFRTDALRSCCYMSLAGASALPIREPNSTFVGLGS